MDPKGDNFMSYLRTCSPFAILALLLPFAPSADAETCLSPFVKRLDRPEKLLYVFAVDAKRVPSFATVSRIRRPEAGGLRGYQRPEVLAHIQEIRSYVESASPMIRYPCGKRASFS